MRWHPPERLAEKIRAGRATLEGERKQVTVLFADVMGSMALAEQSDPEEWRRIMDRFFSILCAGVHRFEGTVDKFTGDGIMGLFGAPIAHEDHARRGCLAVLHLQRELAAYSAELRRAQGLNFSVRMGLNSGEVVVGAIGEDLGMEYTALGHTVGLAQRMEQLAEPGKAYLSEHTAALVRGYLTLVDLGEFQVKGVAEPLRVHELTGHGPARGRLDVARARGFTRFVGRDEEARVLESALEQAFDGQGQVIGIVGEAGVGKSRLCHEFAERQRVKGTPVYHLAGQAHAKSVPLLPVLQLLRAFFEIGERDSERTARERIAGKLLLLDESFVEDLPLIFDFLAVPDPLRPSPQMDPEARQRRLLGLMKRLTHAESAREPGVSVFEDLHWLDPASEDFLANQVEAVQGTQSLLILNFRPEYQAAWMSRSYYRQIALAPLGAGATEEMLKELLGSDPSVDELAELIRERTKGNPFFIEELVQALIEARSLEGERGAYRLIGAVQEAAVPASVQAVLAARIDRLPRREKAVLQAAAVIGKEFPQSVLERVVAVEFQELEDALRCLIAGEFVYEQELYPEALYVFKHPLTQEVAYGSQLGERRGPVHAAVARAIAAQYPDRLDERAALLAQHWEAAEEILEAVRWHARAAGWSGYNDPSHALEHWRKVRELADTLPESAETVALGLEARISWLNYGFRLGVSPEEAEVVFDEAERMTARSGDLRSHALLLDVYGTARALGDGDMRAYATLARQANALAAESGDASVCIAVATCSYALHCTGAQREAVAILDHAIKLADGDPTVGADSIFVCPYAVCLGVKGLAVGELGELDEARRLVEQCRRIAREQGDIETVGWSYTWSVWLAYLEGDRDLASRDANQAIEIAEHSGSAFNRAYASLIFGLAQLMLGEWHAAIEALERSLEITRQRHTGVERDGWRLAILGEAYLGLGDPERARTLVAQALEVACTQGNELDETHACIAQARLLLSTPSTTPREQIAAALARADALTSKADAKAIAPLIHVEHAELARQSGEQKRRQRELRKAHHLFTEIGASRHAQQLSRELATLAS
jgi:adenylate cyclase